jgi:hypothetical protein
MVVLGDTAQVAVATALSGEQAAFSQLRMVDATAEGLGFAAGANSCIPAADLFASANFNQGLSLLSLQDSTGTPWRLVAPANDLLYAGHRLLAYTPWGAGAASCSYSEAVPNPFLAPVVQRANEKVLGLYLNPDPNAIQIESVMRTWVFDPSNALSAWTLEPFENHYVTSTPSFMAIADCSGPCGGGYDFVDVGNESVGTAPSAWAIVDANERYAVFRTAIGNGYQLRRNSVSYLTSSFDAAPVGSPLLGQPAQGSNATAIYVVTVGGVVQAFRWGSSPLQLLPQHLWTENLEISVDPKAQPVLVPNAEGSGTLWVVGTQGEIRGIRVDSHGLHRTAHWPKALRDNCNTSSRQVRYEGTDTTHPSFPMRACF